MVVGGNRPAAGSQNPHSRAAGSPRVRECADRDRPLEGFAVPPGARHTAPPVPTVRQAWPGDSRERSEDATGGSEKILR